MNTSEQKNHKTALRELETAAIEFAEVAMHRINGLAADIAQAEASFAKKIGDERTQRLNLATEQRAYVDQADKEMRRYFERLYLRGFWGRVNWLLNGR